MSACGWSSAEVPVPSSRNFGSTKETCGRVPAAQSVRNVAYGREMPVYFAPHRAVNGESLK
jgi:hypothetical protein